ncbi:MAG: SIMPL domain-containing protein [Clostridia bacterium]|nr:SIMPL domain-containing protein [Clostridia bacterium]
MKTIKVTQSASEKFAPDSIVMRLDLRAENKKYGEAMRLLGGKTAEISAALQNAGLKKEEITTSGACVNNEQRDGKSIFCARSDMRVTLAADDERADSVIDALQKSGSAWTQGYALCNKSYRNELLEKAVSAARDAAQVIASAAGVKLGALVGVEYAADFGGVPRLMRASAVAEPERIEASETVTCEWEIA